MSSAFALAQPRSPATVFSQPSDSFILRSNTSEQFSVKWRSSLIVRRKKQIRENSPNQKFHLAGAYESFSKNDDKRFSEVGKSQMRRKLYVDQQTGEIRLSTTDRTLGYEILEDGETNHIRRYLPNRRIRSRCTTDSSSPRASRCVWDQSLRTKSITINSRGSHSTSNTPPFPMRTSTPQQRCVRNVLPRISRSAENAANTNAYEIPMRYPRGQQRPTTLVSGHHALLLRHREIVEASRKTHDTWKRHRRADDCKRVDTYSKYRSQAYPSSMRGRLRALNDDSRSRRRCGQEVESVMKANRKCLEWFNTWIND